MIHLIENYYAKVTDYGYTLVKDTGKVNKKGDKVYITHGYYGSLEETVKWLIRKCVADKLSEQETELSEALDVILETRKEILYAIRNVEQIEIDIL